VREMEALINSMTPFERKNPDKINPSRKRRIAAGSGREIQDVNRLLKQHKQMAKMMKMISKPEGISKMMKSMQGLMGGGGAGGGGPLFGGGQQGGVKDVNPAQMAKQMGLDPNNMPSTEEMQKQMQELQNQAPKKFKTRF
ncbi:MAG: signal recognition particle protein, partial [Psychrobacter sp.]|nr:signal recognition particle protein [Psychrobacter sp.]